MRRLLSYCFLVVDIQEAVHLARQEHLHSELEDKVEEESHSTGRTEQGRGNT